MSHERAQEIFLHALEFADPAERRAYIDKACAGDVELRKEVESLLIANTAAGQFMQRPAAVAAQKTEPILPLSETPGTRIGRYKLLEQIGEGGFGVVWMAGQEEPVRRRVALKIIKLGMDTKEVVARFEAERQALALMDHPNIASVFDGGATDAGRPYFVMELVKGVPITDYCDANRLSTPQRLGLFMQVCHAVQHAHQKGIIHRDLKPSNILVTVKDDQPMPKVIDFGVAKATQMRLTEKTLFTQLRQWIGTPAYMSPEQAGLGSLDVDTRSDIYSLGVLLYELLTGRTPLDTQKLLERGYDAVMRAICEQEPPKPSTRLSTLSREELTSVAAKRRAEPAKLNRLVHGDLDWIVMKALEKDRRRRYETSDALAQDVGHFLSAEPVSAAAPTLAYRFTKFARRNRAALLTILFLALVLLLGITTSTWQAWRANRYAREANQQQQRATQEAARAIAALADSHKARTREQAAAYANSIALAYREWLNGDGTAARSVMDGCAPTLREWEWRHLRRLTHSALWTAKAGTLQPDRSMLEDLCRGISTVRVEFTADESKVAVFGEGVSPLLLDARTGEKTFDWNSSERRHAGSTSFSRDGRLLAVWGGRGVAFRDTSSMEWRDSAEIARALIAPENMWIHIASGTNGEIQLTGVPTELFPLRSSTGGFSVTRADCLTDVLTNRFDAANSFASDHDGRLILWFPRSESVRRLIQDSEMRLVEQTGDLSLLVCGRNENEQMHLQVSRLTELARKWEFRLPPGAYPTTVRSGFFGHTLALFISCIALDQRYAGLFIVPLSESRTPQAMRYPMDDGRMNHYRTIAFNIPNAISGPLVLGPAYGITDLTFIRNDEALVTAGLDGKIRLWDVDSAQEIRTFRGHSGAISAVAVGGGGQLIATVSRNREIAVWEAMGSSAATEVARLKPVPEEPPHFDAQHEVVSGALQENPYYLIIDLPSRVVRRLPDLQMVSSDGRRALFKVSRTDWGILDIASGKQTASFPVRSVPVGSRRIESHFSGNLEWEVFVTADRTIAFANPGSDARSPIQVTNAWTGGGQRQLDPVLGLNHDGTVLVYRTAAKEAAIVRLLHATRAVVEVARIECSEFAGWLGNELFVAALAKDRDFVRVIDAETGRVAAELPISSESLSQDWDVRFNAARTLVYTTTFSTNSFTLEHSSLEAKARSPVTAHLWTVADGRLDVHLPAFPTGLDLSPNGRRLAFSSFEGALTLINPETAELVCAFDGYGYLLLGFTTTGTHLVAMRADGRVFVYDGSPPELTPPAGAVGRSFEASAALALEEEKMRQATEEKESSLAIRHILEEPLTSRATISPVRNQFAILAQDGSVRLYDFTAQLKSTSRAPATNVNCLAFSSDGDQLLLGLKAGTVLRWNMPNDSYEVITEQPSAVTKLAMLGRSQRLVWARANGTDPEVIDWLTGNRVCRINSRGIRSDGQYWAISSDGTFLAVHALRGKPRGVFVLDSTTGQIQRELLGKSPLSVAFSRDDRLLAAGHAPYDITIWDWKEERLLREIPAHYNWVVALAFSPDGELLVSGGGDSTARVWEVSSGREVGRIRFPGGSTYVNSVGFSPDGELVFAAARDRVVIAQAPSRPVASDKPSK